MSDTFEFDDKAHVERLVGTLHDPAATAGDVLTVQADKSIAARPGGGSGGVQTVTVPVSSAQILDLFNTPVVMIPGTPGFVTVVDGGVAVYKAGAIPYLDGGGNLYPAETKGGGTTVDWIGIAGAGFWDQATDQLSGVGYGQAFQGPAADLDGVDVVCVAETAAPTLGDGTLLVTLSYFLAPTA